MKVKFLEYKGDWKRDVEDDDGNVVEEVNWYFHKILLDGEEIEYYVWRSEYFDEDGDGKGDDKYPNIELIDDVKKKIEEIRKIVFS